MCSWLTNEGEVAVSKEHKSVSKYRNLINSTIHINRYLMQRIHHVNDAISFTNFVQSNIVLSYFLLKAYVTTRK